MLARPYVRDVSRAARHQIYDWLRAEILEANLLPGKPIVEAQIAERFHASRTPVREALLRLADEELVEVIPQVGSFVSRLRLSRIRDGLFVREAIETEIVRNLASTPASHRELAVLDAVIDEHRRAISAGSIKRIFAADEAFHRTLLEAAGRAGVWETVARARQLHSRIRAISVPELNGAERSVAQHRRVLDCIRAGDVEKAVAAMRSHITLNWDFAKTIEQREPELFWSESPPIGRLEP